MGYRETCCTIPQKPKTKIKMRISIEHGKSPMRELPECLEDFTEHFVDEEASASSGQAHYFHTLPQKTDIARSVRGPKLQGVLAEDALEIQYLEQKTL